MSASEPPLLLIAHEASLTGAPRVLLDLVEWARPWIRAPIAVDVLAGGPLTDRFEALADVSSVGVRPQLVLVNSALAAAQAGFEGVPAVVYVHEQGEALDVLPSGARRALRERFDLVLCVSEGSRLDLLKMGVPSELLVVLPPVVTGPPSRLAEPLAPVERELGLQPADVLVLGCGEAGWRKGADLFLQMAATAIRQEERPVSTFAWVGRRPRSFGRMLDHDAEQLGVGRRVRWLGLRTDVGPFLRRADLVVCPSRADPLPLVPLEAALRGAPTVGFDVEGLSDMAACGVLEVVPYPDVKSLGEAVTRLVSDRDAREQLVAGAADLAQQRSVAVIGPRFLQLLGSVGRDGLTRGVGA